MTIATAQADKNPASHQNSASSSGPEITAQENEVRRLESRARWPNRFNIALLAAAGLIAVFIALNSQWLRRATGVLSEAQGTLTQLRMVKVKADAETDAKEKADAAARSAQEKLDEARAEAAKEQTRIENEGKERVAKVEAEASAKIEEARNEANVKIADASRATEVLKSQNLATELRLEEERLRGLNLAKSLARRALPFVGTLGGPSNLDILKPFAGLKVIVEFAAPDREPARAAQQLTQALRFAGWNVISTTAREDLAEPFFDGVIIQTAWPRDSASDPNAFHTLSEIREKPGEAAGALESFLHTNNWVARQFAPAIKNEFPPDSLRVRIGLKPEPEFPTPAELAQDKALGRGPKPIPPRREVARHLTAEQKATLLKTLEDVPTKGSWKIAAGLEIRCPNENEEACSFANEIANVVREANWDMPINLVRADDVPRTLAGILVRTQFDDQFFIGLGLHRAMGQARLEVTLETKSVTRFEPLQIVVGW